MRRKRYLSVITAVPMLACLACSEDPEPRARGGHYVSPPTPSSPNISIPPAAPGPVLPVPSLPDKPSPIWETAPEKGSLLPLTTGTLAISPDGEIAVASDPDRGVVFVADLKARSARDVSLSSVDRLGQTLVDARGNAYVVARGTNEVLRIDTNRAEVGGRYPVCASPHGIALTDADEKLHVACRLGELMTLDAATGQELRTITLDDDLRDVVAYKGGLVVSRFRSAEFIVLDGEGKELRRIYPLPGMHVAWRMRARADGRIAVVHQTNAVGPLFEFNGYSGDCGSMSRATLSVIDVEAPLESAIMRQSLGASGGVLDLALPPSGEGAAVVAPGNALSLEPSNAMMQVKSIDNEQDHPCFVDLTDVPVPEVPISVAYDGEGRPVLQTKNPALLKVVGGETIVLRDDRIMDTGFRMFHMTTGRGIACASCHPEGRDDGYTWAFPGLGFRRTQNLEGTLSSLAPFHWDGSLATFESFVDEALVKRMDLARRPSREETEALASWLATIPAPGVRHDANAESIARGQTLFNDPAVACAACHVGPNFTDDELHDVGTGGKFITPPLVGISVRAPYLHDGCAETLRDCFGICGGGDAHGRTSQLTPTQIDDLVTYLLSLGEDSSASESPN